jgi:hypothetical protein
MVAREASTPSSNVFFLENFQCRGCESFRQVEPSCGASESAGEIPNKVRDLRTGLPETPAHNCLPFSITAINEMQQTMVDDV